MGKVILEYGSTKCFALEILGLDSVLEEEPPALEDDNVDKSEPGKEVKPDLTKAAKDKRVRKLQRWVSGEHWRETIKLSLFQIVSTSSKGLLATR